jgi:hypothetical protein
LLFLKVWGNVDDVLGFTTPQLPRCRMALSWTLHPCSALESMPGEVTAIRNLFTLNTAICSQCNLLFSIWQFGVAELLLFTKSQTSPYQTPFFIRQSSTCAIQILQFLKDSPLTARVLRKSNPHTLCKLEIRLRQKL